MPGVKREINAKASLAENSERIGDRKLRERERERERNSKED